MSRMLDVVVYDAGSLAGEALLEMLGERMFPVGNLYAVADPPEADEVVSFQGKDVDVVKASGFEFVDADVLFLPVGCHASDTLVTAAVAANCLVLDGRMGSEAGPMLLSGLHEEQIDEARSGKVAVIPSSSAAMLLPVLKPLEEEPGIDSVSVTAHLSVSGFGSDAVTELRKQTIDLLNGKPVSGGMFPQRVAFNLLPRVGEFDDQGLTGAEREIIRELALGLDSDDLRINPACVLVPVFFGDSLSVQLELDKAVDAGAVRELLAGVNGVELAGSGECPTVETVAGNDNIVVGRIRHLPDFPGQLALWLVADPVRRGAVHAIEVAEILLKDFLK